MRAESLHIYICVHAIGAFIVLDSEWPRRLWLEHFDARLVLLLALHDEFRAISSCDL